jgi:hypothetical protein
MRPAENLFSHPPLRHLVVKDAILYSIGHGVLRLLRLNIFITYE